MAMKERRLGSLMSDTRRIQTIATSTGAIHCSGVTKLAVEAMGMACPFERSGSSRGRSRATWRWRCGRRAIEQRAEGRLRAPVGVPRTEEAVRGVMAQIDARELPDELLDVER